MKDFNETYNKALDVGKQKHPFAASSHHYSFASGVTYLVTGMSGGIGPTVRVHACSHALAGENGRTVGVQTNLGGLTMLFPDGSLPTAGNWKFEEAIVFCEPICFGPITQIHFDCYRTEYCFDDAEEDLLALRNFRQP